MIVCLILSLLSFSTARTEKMQGTAVALFSPVWNQLKKGLNFLQPNSAAHAAQVTEAMPLNKQNSSVEARRLELDNQLLKMQLKRLQELLTQEIEQNIALSHALALLPEEEALVHNSLIDKKKLLAMQLQALPAQVISRSPSSWNSSLWIDVGEDDNERLGHRIVAKNSPVLLGASVVGVVEYIGKKQSKIRLITDAGLTPSVRSVRGGHQNYLLVGYIDTLIESLNKQGDLLAQHANKKDLFLNTMKELKEALGVNPEVCYLAKGEIQGSSYPLWRKRGNTLKGIGFNYDVADEAGPARDLRTGQAIRQNGVPAIPILKVGDLLVTTGMDGVFPSGLPVAEVTKVHLLKEGDYTYELEAKPTAGNLEELSLVFIIPPV